MLLLLVFLQFQALSLVIVALVLRQSLKQSVTDICENNSTRMDGSYSERRHAIEVESIKQATYSIWGGLATIFVLSSVFELLVAGICCGIWGLGPAQVSGDPLNDPLADFAIVTFINVWQWPMIIGFSVLTIVMLPPYVLYLFRNAQDQYRRRANARFQQYYQMQWLDEQVQPRVDSDPIAPLDIGYGESFLCRRTKVGQE
jgi:hypothetical protein